MFKKTNLIIVASLIFLGAKPAYSEKSSPYMDALLFCHLIEQQKVVESCKVENLNKAIAITAPYPIAVDEARDVCKLNTDLISETERFRSLRGGWTVKIYTPISKKNHLVSCRIK